MGTRSILGLSVGVRGGGGGVGLLLHIEMPRYISCVFCSLIYFNWPLENVAKYIYIYINRYWFYKLTDIMLIPLGSRWLIVSVSKFCMRILCQIKFTTINAHSTNHFNNWHLAKQLHHQQTNDEWCQKDVTALSDLQSDYYHQIWLIMIRQLAFRRPTAHFSIIPMQWWWLLLLLDQLGHGYKAVG